MGEDVLHCVHCHVGLIVLSLTQLKKYSSSLDTIPRHFITDGATRLSSRANNIWHNATAFGLTENNSNLPESNISGKTRQKITPLSKWICIKVGSRFYDNYLPYFFVCFSLSSMSRPAELISAQFGAWNESLMKLSEWLSVKENTKRVRPRFLLRGKDNVLLFVLGDQKCRWQLSPGTFWSGWRNALLSLMQSRCTKMKKCNPCFETSNLTRHFSASHPARTLY